MILKIILRLLESKLLQTGSSKVLILLVAAEITLSVVQIVLCQDCWQEQVKANIRGFKNLQPIYFALRGLDNEI